MEYIIENVLSAVQLNEIDEILLKAEFINGTFSAGGTAALVKNNLQVPPKDPLFKQVQDTVFKAVVSNPQFQAVAFPKAIHSMRIAKYTKGMAYGEHYDSPFMGDQGFRTDLSVTVFLNEPHEYVGGELAINNDRYKLAAGSVIVYPSTSLHEVLPVTKGERKVAVFWVQSRIRDETNREALIDLTNAMNELPDQMTKSFRLLCKTHSNLLRRWAD